MRNSNSKLADRTRSCCATKISHKTDKLQGNESLRSDSRLHGQALRGELSDATQVAPLRLSSLVRRLIWAAELEDQQVVLANSWRLSGPSGVLFVLVSVLFSLRLAVCSRARWFVALESAPQDHWQLVQLVDASPAQTKNSNERFYGQSNASRLKRATGGHFPCHGSSAPPPPKANSGKRFAEEKPRPSDVMGREDNYFMTS